MDERIRKNYLEVIQYYSDCYKKFGKKIKEEDREEFNKNYNKLVKIKMKFLLKEYNNIEEEIIEIQKIELYFQMKNLNTYNKHSDIVNMIIYFLLFIVSFLFVWTLYLSYEGSSKGEKENNISNNTINIQAGKENNIKINKNAKQEEKMMITKENPKNGYSEEVLSKKVFYIIIISSLSALMGMFLYMLDKIIQSISNKIGSDKSKIIGIEGAKNMVFAIVIMCQLLLMFKKPYTIEDNNVIINNLVLITFVMGYSGEVAILALRKITYKVKKIIEVL